MITIIALGITAILILAAGVEGKKKLVLPAMITGIVVTIIMALSGWNKVDIYKHNMLIFDNYSIAFSVLMLSLTLIIFLISVYFYKKDEKDLPDIYALLIFSLAGAVMMVSSGNMAMLFIGIETLSISLYVLAGSKKNDHNSNEAAFKYFLMGAFATCFLILGIALIYWHAGTFNYDIISEYTASHSANLPPLFLAGIILLIVGLGFKIAVAPFHFWAPDVYDGAPTIITAFMATVVKIAGIAAFYRISLIFSGIPAWGYSLLVISVLTILTGNISGIFQTNFKRMLAYSGIAHAGYVLIAMISPGTVTPDILLLYSLSYGVSTLLAFALLIISVKDKLHDTTSVFNGLVNKNPLMASALIISMLSLTGIPPLAGFIAKYKLFSGGIESRNTILVIVALVGTILSAVYYFKPVIAALLRKGDENKILLPLIYKIILTFCILLIVISGLFPEIILKLL